MLEVVTRANQLDTVPRTRYRGSTCGRRICCGSHRLDAARGSRLMLLLESALTGDNATLEVNHEIRRISWRQESFRSAGVSEPSRAGRRD